MRSSWWARSASRHNSRCQPLLRGVRWLGRWNVWEGAYRDGYDTTRAWRLVQVLGSIVQRAGSCRRALVDDVKLKTESGRREESRIAPGGPAQRLRSFPATQGRAPHSSFD